MKNSILVLVACFCSLFLSSCQFFTQKVEIADEKLTEADHIRIRNHFAHLSEVIKFKKSMELRLGANEKLINEYKAGISNNSKNYTTGYKEPILVLDRANNALKKRMLEYKEDGTENWQLFKRDLNKDMDSLGLSMNDIIYANKN